MHIINFLSDHGANRQSGSVGNGFLSQFTEIVRLAAEQDAINRIKIKTRHLKEKRQFNFPNSKLVTKKQQTPHKRVCCCMQN